MLSAKEGSGIELTRWGWLGGGRVREILTGCGLR